MRTRVLIKEMTSAVDAGGGRSEKLSTYAERWACVEPQGGSSSVLAQVLQSTVSHKVTIRYDPNVKAAMFVEIIETGAQLRIDSVVNTAQANVELVLMCSSYKDGSGGR